MLLVAAAALVLLLAAGLGAVGAYLKARVEAAAAADAAALAAAPVTFLPFGAAGSPAEEASRFARLNGAVLESCACPIDRSWEARTVRVEVSKTVAIWPAGTIEVRAVSRAEFVPAMLLGHRPVQKPGLAATFRSSDREGNRSGIQFGALRDHGSRRGRPEGVLR